MKDTVITGKRKKIELITLLCCFVISFALNIYAIITYDGKWGELLTSIFYVVSFALALYVAWSVIRIIFYLICKLFKSK